jgi:DNA invertase Pin-like site-specific DNA recombinase/RNase P subunit RPR2
MIPINSISTIALYIRVSTMEQAREGYSIAAQKERLTAYCKAQGWENIKFYTEEGVSAKDTNRPELQRMFDDMRSGKIQMILVYRLDRFTRRVVDLHKMLEEMQKYNCAFKSATEPYDTSTAMGRMFITIVAALAQWENENLSERIKVALEEKVSGGERVGGVPFGFDMTEEEKLVKNQYAPVILDVIDKIKGGWSANRVAGLLDKMKTGGRNWKSKTVLRVLTNPALYGATRWGDKVFEDTHDGIITKKEFDHLQKVLADRTIHARRDVKTPYLFQGILVCPDCGSRLLPNRSIRTRKKDGSTYHTIIYKCTACYYATGRMGYTPGEARLEKALMEFMQNVEFKNIEAASIEDEREETEYDYLNRQLAQIKRQREKYQKAWATDNMTDGEFENLMKETREILEELNRKIDEHKPKEKVNTEAIKEIVFTFNKTFSFLTQEEKQAFVQQFIRKIEYTLINQPPVNPRSKKGKPKIVFTSVEFY